MWTYHQDNSLPDKGEMENTGGNLRDMRGIQSRAVSPCVCMVPITPQARLEAKAGTKRRT